MGLLQEGLSWLAHENKSLRSHKWFILHTEIMCNGLYHFVFQFSLGIPAVRVSLLGLLEYYTK